MWTSSYSARAVCNIGMYPTTSNRSEYINKLNMILYSDDEQGLISNRIYLSFPLCTPRVNQICKLFGEHG